MTMTCTADLCFAIVTTTIINWIHGEQGDIKSREAINKGTPFGSTWITSQNDTFQCSIYYRVYMVCKYKLDNYDFCIQISLYIFFILIFFILFQNDIEKCHTRISNLERENSSLTNEIRNLEAKVSISSLKRSHVKVGVEDE